jgi:hypothetical protein
MKVLTATKETQGKRSNDFCWTEEGELVNYSFECDGETVDGSCGCKRSLAGLKTLKATTTVKVADLDITEDDLKTQITESLTKGGWLQGQSLADRIEFIEGVYQDTVHLYNYFKDAAPGTVLERRGRVFNVRLQPGA